MKHYIICLIGPSGSGKTSISMTMSKAGIADIVSYTTRPMRPGEKNGREHYFLTKEQAREMMDAHEVAAYTELGGYEYFTLWRQFTQNRVCTYVIDEVGYMNMIETIQARREVFHHSGEFDDFILIPVSIERHIEDILSSGVSAERLRRDQERLLLPLDVFDVRVCNNSKSVLDLQSWSLAFAYSMQYLIEKDWGQITKRGTYICTSNDSVSHILCALTDKVQTII